MLALILVYLFSIIGYVFFKDDFLVPVDDEITMPQIDVAEGKIKSTQKKNNSKLVSIPFELPECSGANEGASVTLGMMNPENNDFCTRPNAPGASVDNGDDGERKERACDSLMMCIITTLNQGLRNGGGIGDILRAPSSRVSGMARRDSLFNKLLNLILL